MLKKCIQKRSGVYRLASNAGGDVRQQSSFPHHRAAASRWMSVQVPPHVRAASLPRARFARLTHAHGMRIFKHMLKYQTPLDSTFHALADPTRRALIERLSRGPATVSELAQPLPISLPAVVQHLQVLEASGLVRSTKMGRVRTCQLEPQVLEQAETWIRERRAG